MLTLHEKSYIPYDDALHDNKDHDSSSIAHDGSENRVYRVVLARQYPLLSVYKGQTLSYYGSPVS